MKLGFDIDICSEPFTLLIKSFFLELPIQSPCKPQWCLLRVRAFIKFDGALDSVTLYPNPEFLAKIERRLIGVSLLLKVLSCPLVCIIACAQC